MKGFLYFERKSKELRIRALSETYQPKGNVLKKRIVSDNVEESERILIWLWKIYRVNKRKNAYKFNEVRMWIKLLPSTFPSSLNQEKVKSLYWLEYQKAGLPDPGTVFYRTFFYKLLKLLFCSSTPLDENVEIWKAIPEQFGYFFRKSAQISSEGRIRWWRKIASKESQSPRKYKRKLLSQDEYVYAKPHIRYGTLCVYSENNPHFQLRRLMYETFIGSIPDSLKTGHLNGDKLDCHLENLTLVEGKNSPAPDRSRLTLTLKTTLLEEWASAKRNNQKLSFSQLALRHGVSPSTVSKFIRSHFV